MKQEFPGTSCGEGQQVQDLEEALATRKFVERAAGVLRAKHGLTEQEAFRRIAKLSMNNRKPMREVAEAILLVEELSVDTGNTSH